MSDGPRAQLSATIVSLFPESLHAMWEASILGRARRDEKLVIDDVQIRDFATDKHRNVDDTPSGGGAGLVMRPDVLAGAIEHACERDEARGAGRRRRVVLLDAAGHRFTQEDARRLASYDHLVLVCGRYEGVDARVHTLVDEALCIGDYVLTGGELGAAVILDATARHVPGVLGNEASSEEESHEDGLLEHRQYTRPNVFRGLGVPDVLRSGDHKKVARARRKDALLRTRKRRPDLWQKKRVTDDDERLLVDEGVPLLDPVPEEG
jgi:tRNA (guanine37-N1)-methyltransferase